MSNNPFHDAISDPPPTPKTHEVKNHPHFFQHAIEGNKLRDKARNMTRQQQFENGLLTVNDMDDEELRAGRMRDQHGRIPKVSKTMEMVPRDLYDAMVSEHQMRTQEKFRQNLDAMLDVMLSCAKDDAAEWKDRTDAAKYIMERVMGKQPERVQVAVSKAPWEDIAMEVGRLTRAQHEARQRGEYIDAEVVEPVVDSGPEPDSDVVGGDGGAQPRYEDQYHATQSPFRAAPAVPSHDQPATSNPITEVQRRVANSDLVRWEQCDTVEVAARRAQAAKRIADAKKARKARRAMGSNGPSRHTIETHEVESPGDPDTGVLRHTID